MFILATSLAAPPPAPPRRTVQAGFLQRTIRYQGEDRRYVLFVPPAYDPARRWPLIMFLHGAGECGSDGWKQVIQGVGSAIQWSVDEWPFLVVFPQKPAVRDAWEDHDAMVQAIMESVERQYKVDATRRYLTGLSQGGHGTWAIAALHPEKWAAIAPVCGYGDAADIGPKVAKLPIWCFHGEDDTAVPVAQSKALCDAVRSGGGSPKLTLYPGVGHNSWDKAYREEKLAAWFLEHQALGSGRR